MLAVEESLGILVNSQKRQLELGIRKSMDLVQMVKRYYQRWNSIRNVIEKRRAELRQPWSNMTLPTWEWHVSIVRECSLTNFAG